MTAREIGPRDGGPDVDLREVCFGGVAVVLVPNRPDADPEKDDSVGVRVPNIAVRSDPPDCPTNLNSRDNHFPNHVTAPDGKWTS